MTETGREECSECVGERLKGVAKSNSEWLTWVWGVLRVVGVFPRARLISSRRSGGGFFVPVD